MDVRRVWVLALVLLSSGVGCLQTSAPSVSPDNRKEADLAQRTPEAKKASAHLFVAYGQMQENNAIQPNVAAQAQQMFREDARQAYEKALEKEPSNAEALLGLARLASNAKDEERAHQYLTKVTKYHATSAVVWYEVGMHYCNHKNWQGALECLGRAHQLDPQNRAIATKYGLTLARAGKINESISCLTPVMGRAQAHYTAARMLAHLNQKEQSKQQLLLALQLQADLQPARALLAQLDSGPQRNPGTASSGIVAIRFDEPAE